MSVLDSVRVNLQTEDYKNLMELVIKEKKSQNGMENYTNSYDIFRSIIPDDFNEECLGKDKFIVAFFNQYVNSMLSRNMEDPRNEILRHDYDILVNSDSLRSISSARDLFMSEDFKKLNFKPIYPQDENVDSRFVHVQGSYLSSFRTEDVQCRIYMCPQMKNITKIAVEIVNRHLQKSLPCYFKFNDNYKDNDRFVLFCSKENLEEHIQIIEDIKREHPELFENMGKNPLWGNIGEMQGVYFGMEPVLNGGYSSYGAIRASIFDSSIHQLKTLYPNVDFENIAITDDMVDKFRQIFELNCLAHNIDPNNVALNKDNNVELEQPLMLKTEKGIDMPIWVNYTNPETMTATISSPVFYKDKEKYIEVTKEELDLLYKRRKEDFDYDRSEQTRNRVCSRLQKLHTQNKIDYALSKVNPVARYKSKMIVQKSLDGKVFVGGYLMNESLYKILPYKISLYIAKKMKQTENIENKECDILLNDEIAEIATSISGAGVFQKKEAEQIISDNFMYGNYEVGKEETSIINNSSVSFVETPVNEEIVNRGFK